MDLKLGRLSRWRRKRPAETMVTFTLVALGPILAVVTMMAFGPFGDGGASGWLRLILTADLVYVLVIAALVGQRVFFMVVARRQRSAGSRLHLRLTGVFALLALIPTVLVAVFAVVTINNGLEGWFSDRVRNVVGSSLAAAQAYEEEHRQQVSRDGQALANYLENERRNGFYMSPGEIRQALGLFEAQIERACGAPRQFLRFPQRDIEIERTYHGPGAPCPGHRRFGNEAVEQAGPLRQRLIRRDECRRSLGIGADVARLRSMQTQSCNIERQCKNQQREHETRYCGCKSPSPEIPDPREGGECETEGDRRDDEPAEDRRHTGIEIDQARPGEIQREPARGQRQKRHPAGPDGKARDRLDDGDATHASFLQKPRGLQMPIMTYAPRTVRGGSSCAFAPVRIEKARMVNPAGTA